MSNFNQAVNSYLIMVVLMIGLVYSQVTWTDLPQLRMGQTSIYDDVYFPLASTSTIDVTYKKAFAAAGTYPDTALVLSGFQNYLHYQMFINVTMTFVNQNKFTVSVYVGATTYVKQLNVNYFVMQAGGAANLDPYIQVSIGNYRTLDLDDANGLRTQLFTNQTTSFPTVYSVCSAIHGLQYYNYDGVLNQINVNTDFKTTPGTIRQQVNVLQKGILNYISLTTIIISTGFYPTPNQYLNLGYTFQTTITSTNGFTQLNAISASGLFTSTDYSMFFGIRAFKFNMEGTRLFLLAVATQTDFRTNLQTNSYMQYTQLSIMFMVTRSCPAATPYFWVQGFQCKVNCPGLMQDSTNKVCLNCDTVCLGCTGSIGNCDNCQNGNFRIKNTSAPQPTCVCQYSQGYVQYQDQDKCSLCSDLIPGCVRCSSPTSCDDCGDTTIYQKYQNGSDYKCRCLNNKFLVTGVCLSYAGCLKANKYVTGQFCQQCDDSKNFKKNLTNNSSCICKTAYFLNNATYACQDKCGDQKTPDSPVNATDSQIICDDGNTQSGDGCSSACRQQYGYSCTVEYSGGISSCAQKYEVSITYLYSQKNLISNQATIVFYLTPQQHFLPQTAFQGLVNTNLPGSYKVKFDATNSLILVIADYTKTLQKNEYQFNFTFSGLDFTSSAKQYSIALSGINAKLQISSAPQQVNIITYVALAVSAFALALALVSSFLGQKLMGIELILPVQAAYFTICTFPQNILSPISALWSLKYSNGYNTLQNYDLSTNYMLNSRVTIMKYSGQYILNYNIMFILLAVVILAIGIIAIRIAWLQRQQKRLEGIQKKKQDQDRQQPKKKKKQKDSQDQKEIDKQTQQQTNKEQQINLQVLQEQLQDARQNMKNWKNFMYMIFDRFFAILIVTAMMKVIFCFYIQLSNLTYTAEIYDNSLNAGFFFITYATIVTGLYAIIYDYKTDKLIVFTCNKGKYAIFYISIFLGYIIVLGATFETSIAVYIAAVFSLMPIVLIPYQVPYGLRMFDFQAIIAMICQLPFLVTVAVSLILNFQKDGMKEETSLIFAYVIIGTIGLSIILTMVRMIKIIDCKKISCVQFTDRKKQNNKDKNKKRHKVALIDLSSQYYWKQEDSVRSVLNEKNKQEENLLDSENKQVMNAEAKKNKNKQTENEKQLADGKDDEDVDELQNIKRKLRNDLKQKKVSGKIK